jgi:hypothetical protein
LSLQQPYSFQLSKAFLKPTLCSKLYSIQSIHLLKHYYSKSNTSASPYKSP